MTDLAPLMGGLLAAAKRAEYFQTGEAPLLLKAFDTLKQMQTDLDARFEHSDHLSAKYYQRMRAAEKEAAMRRSESADFERERDEADQRAQAAENAIADALAWMDAGDGRLHGHPLRRILSTYEQKGTDRD